MAVAPTPNPLRRNRFIVEVDEVQIQGVRQVTLPVTTTDQTADGWGQTRTQDLVIERVIMDANPLFYDWRQAVIDDDEAEAKREVTIEHLDDDRDPVIEWTFEDAWPKTYRPSSLESGLDDAENIATEELTLAYESVTREEA